MKKHTSYIGRFSLVLGLVLALIVAGTTATATPISPVYNASYGDAVTGDNEFLDESGNHRWFVNTGADSYEEDYYERPTVQTYDSVTASVKIGDDSELVLDQSYSASGTSDPSYFEYLDITSGFYGYDDTFMYFGIELYGTEKVGTDGSRDSDFGESSYYRIRFSESESGAGGLMLSAEAASALGVSGNDWYQQWDTKASMGYLDTNSDIGGPGGITVTGEDSGNGFEDKIISDGYLDRGSKPDVLWTRFDPEGEGTGPQVSFAFDYRAYNALLGQGSPDELNPYTGVYHIIFEANRGLKDNGNYLWNDEYSLSEAGSPYWPSNETQNIYELDTLRVIGQPAPVPEPATMVLLGAGLIGLAGIGRRQLRE